MRRERVETQSTPRRDASTVFSRRTFCAAAAGALTGPMLAAAGADEEARFKLRYLLGSCMYGYTPLAEILPEVRKTGAEAIDIWPKVHGNQREQLEEMGERKFAALLDRHNVSLGCITQYKLGPFGLQEEMRLAQRLGCHTMVTGGRGAKGLRGSELKAAVAQFIEKMKPHLAVAEETGVTIAIENHGNNLIESPDSLKWLAELRPSPRLSIAFAPYHLPGDERLLANLIRDLGGSIAVFYAWQHGMGCMKKLPKKQELLQMPGRGNLDFRPLLGALREINYTGWTEIFMHPVPRGIPILETTAAVTREINRARDYLTRQLRRG
ncbi:MAG: sugar phosphate isomerase/epimerase family protein [Planctomycetota bacterium]